MTAVRKDRPPREPWRWWMLPVLVYILVVVPTFWAWLIVAWIGVHR